MIIFFWFLLWFIGRAPTTPEIVTPPQINLRTHPLVFFDENMPYAGTAVPALEAGPFAKHAYGGIIPHHLFPSFIITDFFNRLSKQNPKTIILIGPNHYERGNYKVLSSLYGWETPYGVVEPNEQIIQELVANKLVEIDEATLPSDHSVAGLMTFVKQYLPDTKVVPLLLSGFMSEQEARILSDGLRTYMNEDTVLVAAVDFSHFLTSPQAKEKDDVSLKLMKDFEYQKILFLDNEYLDSPPSIVVLLMTMQTLGSTEMELLHHTNSGEMQKNNSIQTTSYFSIVYY